MVFAHRGKAELGIESSNGEHPAFGYMKKPGNLLHGSLRNISAYILYLLQKGNQLLFAGLEIAEYFLKVFQMIFFYKTITRTSFVAMMHIWYAEK